jgi:hypothetical protein
MVVVCTNLWETIFDSLLISGMRVFATSGFAAYLTPSPVRQMCNIVLCNLFGRGQQRIKRCSWNPGFHARLVHDLVLIILIILNLFLDWFKEIFVKVFLSVILRLVPLPPSGLCN